VHILGHNISTIEKAGGHVLAVAGVALDHLVVWLEAGHGDFLDRVGLVSRLRCRDNWGVSDKREMDARVWDEIGLELVQVDVERAVETEGGGDRGDDWTEVSYALEI
jgi:hypothetical protein